MKKILSLAMVLAMIASISVCAFAASNSPSQGTEPAPGVVSVKPADQDKDNSDAEEEALNAEKEAVKHIKEANATNDDAEEIEIAIGEIDRKNASDSLVKSFDGLMPNMLLAKNALAKGEDGVIKSALGDKIDSAASPAATQPFRAAASKYPCVVTLEIDNPEDFLGMMIWENGRFVDLECRVDVDASTVTFTLQRPSIICLVYNLVTAP